MINSYEDKAERPKNKDKKKPKVPKKISDRYLYNSGIAYLQRFPASSIHFKSVMMRKIQKSCRHHIDQNIEDCEKMLDDLVIKFQELGLLDDVLYLKGMVTSLRRRGLSSMQIIMKLRQKGYETEDIKKEIRQFDEDEFHVTTDNDTRAGELQAARIFARKKKLGPYDTNNRKTPEQALGVMARAGYNFDVAKRTLDLSLEDIEEYF